MEVTAKPLRVSFEGNIGVGKSTILKLLQSHPRLQEVTEILQEPIWEWQNVNGTGLNMLDAFYKDPKRNAYLFQSFVFTTRFLQQNAAASQSKAALLLMERSVLTDRCVFVETATDQGYFNPLEVAAYDAWYDGVVTTLPNVVPDAFVYLRADPNVCYDRLKTRARSEEVEVSLEYLQSLHSKHENWFIESAFKNAGNGNWGGKSHGGYFVFSFFLVQIPPLFLDVQPHHKVLDMCAAPGSKTFQLLEMIHRDVKPGELSDGMVIANDSDVQRCHLLIHQTKRMCSPNIMVTNHDAQLFPGLKDKSGHLETTSTDAEIWEEETNGLYFDRILCDVPCSGDGTLRKAPDIWRKWNCGVANGLHRLQIQIAMRGVALLRTGGRLVYSTCSLNPVEDEAVVGEILRESGGSVELLDVSSELPELKRRPGLTSWLIRDRKRWLCSASKIDRHRAGAVVPSMFPSGNGWDLSDLELSTGVSSPPTDAEDEIEKKDAEEAEDDEGPPEVATLPLERCMRLLPHDQDTGGFFIAVFRKIAPFKAIPKIKESHKSRLLRSEKETLTAEGETGLLVPVPIETDSTVIPPFLPAPKGDSLDIQIEDAIEVENEVGVEEPVSDNVEAGEDLSESVASKEQEEKLVETTASDTKDPNAIGRIQRQGRWKGVDPVLFLKDEKIISSLVDFYGIKETFPVHQHLVVRSEDVTRCKRIYYVSASVANTIQQNFRAGEQMKITSAGLKIFERQQTKEATTCIFRIASEGLPVLLPHMTKQIVIANRKDFRLLLAEKVVQFSAFSDSTFAAALRELKHGCCVVALPTEGPDAATNTGAMGTAVACWKGRSNVGILITKAEANQMHQRISFADDDVSRPQEAAVAVEAELEPTQGDDLTSTDAGSELKGGKSDQVLVNSIAGEPQNGTVPSKAEQLFDGVQKQTEGTLVGGDVSGDTPEIVEMSSANS